jgi:hypothetical protein
MDTEEGKPQYPDAKKTYGTLKTCFDLFKLMDFQTEFEHQALVHRFQGEIIEYVAEKD